MKHTLYMISPFQIYMSVKFSNSLYLNMIDEGYTSESHSPLQLTSKANFLWYKPEIGSIRRFKTVLVTLMRL